MGAVYSAYDLNLDRKVAIKLLLRRSSSPEEQLQSNQRLLREAQAMAKLSHPNVVPVYEAGIEGDTVFIAMEYVAGKTLEQWIESEHPPWGAIIDVFTQAGRGLAAAHDAGIIHRDFKPANVLLDARGHARVTDFGIARLDSDRDSGEIDPAAVLLAASATKGDLTPPSASTPLTAAGALVGTPAYMSPEQYRRSAVDARSDQFSFCVALYEALFGKRPFAGRGKELADRVTRGEMEKIDPRSPVPGRIIALVMRGLAPDPDARFPSMAALVDALGRDPGRRRRQLALAAGAAVAIAAGAALVGWRLHARDDATGGACDGAADRLAGVWDPAVRTALERRFVASGAPYAAASMASVVASLDGYRTDWISMHTDTCRATRVRGDQSEHVMDLRMVCLDRRRSEVRALTSLLVDSPDPSTIEKAVEATSTLTPLAGCADTAVLLQPGIEPSDPVARARSAGLRSRLDRLIALRRLGRDKSALAPARALVAEARTAGDDRLLAESLATQGMIELGAGALEASATTLDEALRRARATGSTELFSDAIVDLAEFYAAGGISTSKEGLGVVRVAQAVADGSRNPALPIRLLVANGRLYLTLAHRELALPLLQQAVARSRETLPADHPMLLRAQSMLATTLSFNKRHAEALAEYESLIAAATRRLGALHPMTVMARLDLCRARGSAGDLEHTAACYDAALTDADRVVGANSRGVITARAYYGIAMMSAGKADAAHAVYAAAFDQIPAEAWREHWYIASDISRGLAEIELDHREFAQARQHCERARDATEEKHRGIGDQTCIGEAQLGLGDAAGALVTLEAVQAEAGTADPAQVGPWRFALARAVWAAHHDVKRTRALAAQARTELATPAGQRDVDTWLNSVPKR